MSPSSSSLWNLHKWKFLLLWFGPQFPVARPACYGRRFVLPHVAAWPGMRNYENEDADTDRDMGHEKKRAGVGSASPATSITGMRLQIFEGISLMEFGWQQSHYLIGLWPGGNREGVCGGADVKLWQCTTDKSWMMSWNNVLAMPESHNAKQVVNHA